MINVNDRLYACVGTGVPDGPHTKFSEFCVIPRAIGPWESPAEQNDTVEWHLTLKM